MEGGNGRGEMGWPSPTSSVLSRGQRGQGQAPILSCSWGAHPPVLMPFLSVLTACLGSLGGPGRLLHLLYESEAETVGSIPGPLAFLYQDVWVSWLGQGRRGVDQAPP